MAQEKGSGNKSSGLSGPTFAVIGLIVLLIWALTGIYTIKEAERGVVLRFGEFSRLRTGLRWKPTFIDKAIPVDIKTIRYMPASGFMLIKDENVVRVEMEIQCPVMDPFKYTFAVTDPAESLRQALASAIRYVVGHSKWMTY